MLWNLEHLLLIWILMKRFLTEKEMSTLEHVPVTKIVQEQMIHYRNAWLHLARACAAVVDSDLKVDAFSNVESVNAGLTKNLFEFSSESFSASAKLEALKKEHGVVSIQLEQIAAKLRSKTTELDIATHVVSDLREKMDGFARDVKVIGRWKKSTPISWPPFKQIHEPLPQKLLCAIRKKSFNKHEPHFPPGSCDYGTKKGKWFVARG